MSDIGDGIGLEKVVIPAVCLPICLAFQAYEFYNFDQNKTPGTRALFMSVRSGWVQGNFSKGTVACNTTRDYIKAAVFYSNTAIALTTFTVGYAGSEYTSCLEEDGGCDGKDVLLLVKLGVLAGIFLIIFFVFTQCTRFAVHFSFCINTQYLDGVSMPHGLLLKIFNHAHHYNSLGIRLYFGTIPVFAWIFHAYALAAVTPLYLYMVHKLEDSDFVEDELKKLVARQEELKRNGPGADDSGVEFASTNPALGENAMTTGKPKERAG